MSSIAGSVEDRVFARVAEMTGVPRSNLRLTTDLYRDLGVTGDDAEELLIALAQEHMFDLKEIRFDRHFTREAFAAGEGGCLQHALWMVTGILLFAFAGIGLGSLLSLGYPLPEWSKYLLFVACLGWVFVWIHLGNLLLPGAQRWRRERIPVTIQDLIAAARDKRWPINYEGR